MQEQTAYEEIEFKDHKKAERMLRSESARARRKTTKSVIEAKVENEWGKARRQRQHMKKVNHKHHDAA